jgi:hypothetical protein
MSGITEVLLIIVIVLAIFMLPRLLKNQPEDKIQSSNQGQKLSGWKRLAILISILWPVFFAFYLKPWSNPWQIFLYVGICPVVAWWGIFWVFSGFKKKDK